MQRWISKPGSSGSSSRLQGNFAAAASAPADEKSRSVARLGNALAAAFPVSLPPGRYLRVIARGGVAFEGFAEETPEGIRLMQATGASLTLPTDTVTSKQEVPKETAIAGLVERIAKQGKDPGAKVPGLFLMMEQALRLSEERYRLVSSVATDLLYSCSQNAEGFFVIDWATASVDRVFGYSLDDILQQGCWR